MESSVGSKRYHTEGDNKAYRLRGQIFREEFDRSGPVQHLLLRYTLDQQLCRWLLLSLDRLPSNELSMTQGLIPNMLGARREGVTAGQLQRAGLINYHRGKITVIGRPGLEAPVCECHEVVRTEFRRLLPDSEEPTEK